MRRLLLFIAVVGCCLLPINLLAGNCERDGSTTHLYMGSKASPTLYEADFDECYSLVGSGDTIHAGAGNETWTENHGEHGVSTLRVSIVGAGQGVSVITTTGSHHLFRFELYSSADSIRLSGFTINFGTGDQSPVQIHSEFTDNVVKGFRIDHTTFHTTATGKHAISLEGRLYGVIDSNISDGAAFFIIAAAYLYSEMDPYTGCLGGDCGKAADEAAINFGSDEAIYIENNLLTYGTGQQQFLVDGNYATRVVARYNDIYGAQIHAHCNINVRCTVNNEIYNNYMRDNGTLGYFPTSIRGGTGLIFNNDILGYSPNQIFVDYRRAWDTIQCDGTATTTDMDYGDASAAGWPCWDQIGWHGPKLSQVNTPLYSWNNTGTNGLVAATPSTYIKNDISPHATSGTGDGDADYCNHSPATSCGNVAGWTYNPYACPHPLADPLGVGSCDTETAGIAGYHLTGSPSSGSHGIYGAGTTVNLTFDQAVSVGAGGNGGFTLSMSGGASTMTYASGGSTTTLVYNLSRTIQFGETGTVSYTQPGNGIEAASGGADVTSFASHAVTNSSTYKLVNETLQITTDIAATCKYDTVDVIYASMANTYSTTGGTTHTQSLSDLTCGQSYTYYSRCSADNATSATHSFSINAVGEAVGWSFSGGGFGVSFGH